MRSSRPLLIGHRGASGYFPEHTLPSYALAILQGADYIEPDLVATRDGVLVARHENEIGSTTDVAAHPQFAARRRVQQIDGEVVDGWFTEDFTFGELRTLRARERLPALRPASAAHDGQFPIPSLAEILQFLASVNAPRRASGAAPVGVYPETKHPSHFRERGLPLEPALLAELARAAGDAPVFIQSFEVGNLEQLREQCAHPLVQLMAPQSGPWDRQGTSQTYAGMATAPGLAGVMRYANAIGVAKSMVIDEQTGSATGLVQRAHDAGLAVHVWTLRAENQFLPPRFRRGEDVAAHGDLAAEVRTFVDAGVDGLFADFPDIVKCVLDEASPR